MKKSELQERTRLARAENEARASEGRQDTEQFEDTVRFLEQKMLAMASVGGWAVTTNYLFDFRPSVVVMMLERYRDFGIKIEGREIRVSWYEEGEA